MLAFPAVLLAASWGLTTDHLYNLVVLEIDILQKRSFELGSQCLCPFSLNPVVVQAKLLSQHGCSISKTTITTTRSGNDVAFCGMRHAKYAQKAQLQLLDAPTFVSKGLIYLYLVFASIFTPIGSHRAPIAYVGM